MTPDEQALTFECEGETLVGVLSPVRADSTRGVLIVVGGPQYRAGSHRQFTLLARHLAERGLPVMRFDCRGMGDSGGAQRTFEDVGADIRCAIDCFLKSTPSLTDVSIWGLCDAASAALLYAWQDPRVSGLVLLNPWVRTEQGVARAYLRHYYVDRLRDPALWRKIARGELNVRKAFSGIARLVADALGRGKPAEPALPAQGNASQDSAPLPDRMETGLRRFSGPVLLILSGSDLTAQEFKDLVARSRGWRRLVAQAQISRRDLPDANHTFSRRDWRDQVASWTESWVKGYR